MTSPKRKTLPPPPPEWGNHLKRLLGAAGLTQRALAEEIGVAEGTVSKWTDSVRYPEPVHLLAIRDALRERGVVETVDEILEPQSRVRLSLDEVASRLDAIEQALRSGRDSG